MASLQDQLLKAGLVDKNKANKASKDKQKQANLVRKSGAKTDNAVKRQAQQERDRKLARDRELNLQKQQASSQKAITAQVKQLIEMNCMGRDEGEIPYSFIYKNRVKSIAVTADLKNQLTLGRLAIVTFLLNSQRKFEIVPAPVAEKITQRDADAVVHLNQKVEMEEDDPYADFQVPDDLTW
jgi:uncharacterized protein YaiL (DUF2058 family)